MTKTIPQITKVQELVYELNTESAMSTDLITVSPDTPMEDIREILKVRRISGLPVVSDAGLVGIISIEDFIEWVFAGSRKEVVAVRMSVEVQSIFADEPLVQAVNLFDRFGFGRLPVLDRRSQTLVGIVTKGDIITKLLHVLDLDYHEEEIRNYRASQFFDDIVADETLLTFRYTIAEHSIEAGGTVASAMKKTLTRLGVCPSVVRRVSIAAYEAEMNVIIYASSGTMCVYVDGNSIRLEVNDSGPGIADLDAARRPGYSPAPEWVRELGFGAGMGLANIEACADQFKLDSRVGSGTRLGIHFLTDDQCA